MSRIHVSYCGSNIFEPTHYSLIALFNELNKVIDITVYAKHPKAHPHVKSPEPVKLSLSGGEQFIPDSVIVHAIGGGETAIQVASAIPREMPFVLTFVGGADITRQLADPRLREGYKTLLGRADIITYPDEFAHSILTDNGLSDDKMVHIPAAVPLGSYPHRSPENNNIVISAARNISRKNHKRAVQAAILSKNLEKLVLVGGTDCEYKDDRIVSLQQVSHEELIKLVANSYVYLQTADWNGNEVDSLPTIVLEVLAMGMPVVSTPLHGVVMLSKMFPDFIRIGDSAQDLAFQIDELLRYNSTPDNTELHRWIIDNHGIQVVAERIMSLYERILSRKKCHV